MLDTTKTISYMEYGSRLFCGPEYWYLEHSPGRIELLSEDLAGNMLQNGLIRLSDTASGEYILTEDAHNHYPKIAPGFVAFIVLTAVAWVLLALLSLMLWLFAR